MHRSHSKPISTSRSLITLSSINAQYRDPLRFSRNILHCFCWPSAPTHGQHPYHNTRSWRYLRYGVEYNASTWKASILFDTIVVLSNCNYCIAFLSWIHCACISHRLLPVNVTSRWQQEILLGDYRDSNSTAPDQIKDQPLLIARRGISRFWCCWRCTANFPLRVFRPNLR